MIAFEQGDFATALQHFERFIDKFPDPDAEYMAFFALLLSLNPRVAEALPILARVGAGGFRLDHSPDRWQYPEAFARYLLAFLADEPDVIERWEQAQAVRPRKGFASENLKLPDNPQFAVQNNSAA
jgi:tetratricopeptide (TPR) repeat protein